jgi:microcystin degradation protein MlrC
MEPYADVAQMGMSVVTVAERDPTRQRTLPESIAGEVWRRRDDMTAETAYAG